MGRFQAEMQGRGEFKFLKESSMAWVGKVSRKAAKAQRFIGGRTWLRGFAALRGKKDLLIVSAGQTVEHGSLPLLELSGESLADVRISFSLIVCLCGVTHQIVELVVQFRAGVS